MTTCLPAHNLPARRSRLRTTRHAWLTFGEVAHLLRLEPHTRRTLQRKLLNTGWQHTLQIQRLEPVHGRRLHGLSKEAPQPWVMSRQLVLAHRRALLQYLFG